MGFFAAPPGACLRARAPKAGGVRCPCYAGVRVAALEALLERREAAGMEPAAMNATTGLRKAQRETAGTERAGRVLPLPGCVTGVRERIAAKMADDRAEATGATPTLGGGKEGRLSGRARWGDW